MNHNDTIYDNNGNAKATTAIENNGAKVYLKGDISITTDYYCWAAIDISAESYQDAYLYIDEYASLSFTDNRSEDKKNDEPLIKCTDYYGDKYGNYYAYVYGYESQGLTYVEKSNGNGYDLAQDDPGEQTNYIQFNKIYLNEGKDSFDYIVFVDGGSKVTMYQLPNQKRTNS